MVTLRPLDAGDDFGFLLELEKEHFEQGWIGHDGEDVHRARIERPDCRYFIIERDGVRAGFVIVMDIEPVHRNVLVKRIALAQPGRGTGREALRLVVDLAFAEWNAHRLWLDVYEDNPRARRVYQALGFREEGTQRECVWHGGRWRSLVILSMLEGER